MTPVAKLACAAAAVLLPLALAGAPAPAQQPAPATDTSRMHAPVKPDEHGHGRTMKTDPLAKEAPSTVGYVAASEHMHHAMAVDLTGNADVDFVAVMIPHHEGAVAMARVVLQHGKDPEIRKLAEAIIAAQDAEIALMKEWQRKNRP
jgi:uncharacterized protein (DUF305 family)